MAVISSLIIELLNKHAPIKIKRVKTIKPFPLDGDSDTIRNFGQNDTNRGKSAVEAPRS